MADNPKAFKHGLAGPAIRLIARNIKRAEPPFSGGAFIKSATTGLEALELKARVAHTVAALRQHLPADEVVAIDVLLRAGADWDNGKPTGAPNFAAWPVIEFVGVHGLAHFDTSMEALRRLTGVFSAEFAVRGFIERYPSKALKLLKRWAGDPDEHVRRLVSEGTRPRLPWGRRLDEYVGNPRPLLPLLEKLKDDPAEYVRRSVANNLNDIAKDHPDVVVDLCRRWAKKASPERQWVIRRATRTLVKQGNAEALQVLGFNPRAKITVGELGLSRKRFRVGEQLNFSFDIRSRSTESQSLVIDYAVHHVKNNGKRTAKVFKLKTLDLSAKETVSISKKHGFRPISTRTYYSGKHALEILVNGKSRGLVEFDLKV